MDFLFLTISLSVLQAIQLSSSPRRFSTHNCLHKNSQTVRTTGPTVSLLLSGTVSSALHWDANKRGKKKKKKKTTMGGNKQLLLFSQSSRLESKLLVIARGKNWKKTVQNHKLQTEILPTEYTVITAGHNCYYYVMPLFQNRHSLLLTTQGNQVFLAILCSLRYTKYNEDKSLPHTYITITEQTVSIFLQSSSAMINFKHF